MAAQQSSELADLMARVRAAGTMVVDDKKEEGKNVMEDYDPTSPAMSTTGVPKPPPKHGSSTSDVATASAVSSVSNASAVASGSNASAVASGSNVINPMSIAQVQARVVAHSQGISAIEHQKDQVQQTLQNMQKLFGGGGGGGGQGPPIASQVQSTMAPSVEWGSGYAHPAPNANIPIHVRPIPTAEGGYIPPPPPGTEPSLAQMAQAQVPMQSQHQGHDFRMGANHPQGQTTRFYGGRRGGGGGYGRGGGRPLYAGPHADRLLANPPPTAGGTTTNGPPIAHEQQRLHLSLTTGGRPPPIRAASPPYRPSSPAYRPRSRSPEKRRRHSRSRSPPSPSSSKTERKQMLDGLAELRTKFNSIERILVAQVKRFDQFIPNETGIEDDVSRVVSTSGREKEEKRRVTEELHKVAQELKASKAKREAEERALLEQEANLKAKIQKLDKDDVVILPPRARIISVTEGPNGKGSETAVKRTKTKEVEELKGLDKGTSKPQPQPQPQNKPDENAKSQSKADDKTKPRANPKSDDMAKSKANDKVKSRGEDKAKSKGEDKAKSRGEDKVKSRGEDKAKSKGEDKAKSKGEEENKAKSQAKSQDNPQNVDVNAKINGKLDSESSMKNSKDDNTKTMKSDVLKKRTRSPSPSSASNSKRRVRSPSPSSSESSSSSGSESDESSSDSEPAETTRKTTKSKIPAKRTLKTVKKSNDSD